MRPSGRIVVFTGDLTYSVRRGIVEIDETIHGLSWLVVVHAPRKSAAILLRNQWRNLIRNGWRWIPYQTGDIFRRIFSHPTQLDSSGPGAEFGLAALESRPNLQVLRAADIHAEATLERVRVFEPDLGLSLAAPILRGSLFSIPKLGTLNLHKGKVPDYRGMPPAFWELWNDEAAVGCTVHRVDEKLDTGDVLREAEVERQRFSTLRGLQLTLDEVGISLMREAVSDVLNGSARPTPQRSGGKTYRKPTLSQVATLKRKLSHIEPNTRPVAKHLVKEAAFYVGIALWYMALRWLLAPRVTVLLYHRVSDDARDNLTVGIEQFDRQMALLRRHCRVLSIDDVVADRGMTSGRPAVCVTFDDGYLDNYLHAVPILLKHAIPAAFFVSTRIVGTERAFPHDLRRGNQTLPVMNWDQLREMRGRGFIVGSHSMSHIDCAAEPEEIVRSELAGSLADLKRELGTGDILFAYPYGGRQHMTPQRLELVKQAGYKGCLSAYGGVNVSNVDRFNVLRGGMQWEFSDRAFFFQCLGLA